MAVPPAGDVGLLQREDAMPEATLRRMVPGVSCRDYEAVADLGRERFGVKMPGVSRGLVNASAVKELAARRFDEVRFAAIFLH